MELTDRQRNKIRNAALQYLGRFATQARCAHALEINVAQFSGAIVSGKLTGVLSDANWLNIASKLGVMLDEAPDWKIAPTKVFIYLSEQFEMCQRQSISGIFCEVSDSGKTVAAEYYASTHKGAIRVDCSIFKTKRRLVMEIARQLGIPKKGNYWEIYDALIWELNNTDHPLIILDEFGDLQYEAFLEVKGLWNATQYRCGWFMMGADALRVKMESGMLLERVGFREIFSRGGTRFQSCISRDAEARKKDLATQAAMVAKLNAPEGTDIQKIITRNEGSMRRIYTEITKSAANGTNG